MQIFSFLVFSINSGQTQPQTNKQTRIQQSSFKANGDQFDFDLNVLIFFDTAILNNFFLCKTQKRPILCLSSQFQLYCTF